MSKKVLEEIADKSRYLVVSDHDGRLTICDKKILVDLDEIKRLAGAERETKTLFIIKQRSILYRKASSELRVALLNLK